MFPCARCGSDRANIDAECTQCGWRPEPLTGHRHTDSDATANWQQSQSDADHLRLLSIFHYVVAGILALCSLFPLIHLAVGIAIVTGRMGGGGNGNQPPAFFGWFFIFLASAMILCGLALAICVATAGRRLRQYRSYTFCLVIAGIECMFSPFGTVLGVFTIIVLMRPTVKERFGVAPSRRPDSA
jgi:hypothetical protein